MGASSPKPLRHTSGLREWRFICLKPVDAQGNGPASCDNKTRNSHSTSETERMPLQEESHESEGLDLHTLPSLKLPIARRLRFQEIKRGLW
jgi:hypothetical protein